MPLHKLSIVLAVRNRQHQIADRIEQLIDGLAEWVPHPFEVIVVDDGSRDQTFAVVDALCAEHPQLRLVRHDRPRGMEAAGQTGLERATGDLVFIQESDTAVCLQDLQQLLSLAQDDSVVAAQAESRREPIAPSLVRRLRAWGTDADQQLQPVVETDTPFRLQMLRRHQLQRLAAPQGDRYRLRGQTFQLAVAKR
ncbi:glycosyltransferase [Stieleria sp. TO1_6]|uniref:glycosyltransferase family 2 protein n=1 Tax=Stieleria tagensis TaxID=2956795 RepID=UPI00209AA725|nr:glycosyltransferase [Stieleria tagensis]MCO8123699.1 glycosyltransferase [Stieleria tagensis]